MRATDKLSSNNRLRICEHAHEHEAPLPIQCSPVLLEMGFTNRLRFESRLQMEYLLDPRCQEVRTDGADEDLKDAGKGQRADTAE